MLSVAVEFAQAALKRCLMDDAQHVLQNQSVVGSVISGMLAVVMGYQVLAHKMRRDTVITDVANDGSPSPFRASDLRTKTKKKILIFAAFNR